MFDSSIEYACNRAKLVCWGEGQEKTQDVRENGFVFSDNRLMLSPLFQPIMRAARITGTPTLLASQRLVPVEDT